METSILGGYQSDFARNLVREGRDISDLVGEVVEGTLAGAGVGPEQIESIHVGNAFGQLYTGQGHLGAMPATVVPELWGVPAMRHEAACASGSIAVLAAMAEIEAGRYDCILVVGVEQEKTLPGPEAAQLQTAAAWVGRETDVPGPIWPRMFDRLADEYDRRFGLDDCHLRALGQLNLGNAKANPNAQTRSWTLEDASFADDDHANPVIAGRLRRNDCCQITDGGAGLVLVSDRWLAANRGAAPSAVIAGWGHRTVGLALDEKLKRSRDDSYVMPHVHQAIQDAFGRAGIGGVDDLDLIETHDCMTPSEYMAIDHFGITAPGQSWKAIESGELERGGRIPVNPSGGLIGGGHPVGATGIRMLVDASKQVSQRAEDYQVDGARRAATLNIGGSTATTVSFIVEQRDD
ncbi:MAG: acetyl-CoA acetyltransferase [Deltaproteobacteria bacterium]